MPNETVRVVVDDAELVRWIAKTKGKPVRVVADGVEYGIYQEMGTEKIGARPCAKPAAEAVRPGFTKAYVGARNVLHTKQIVEKAARDVERLWKQHIVTK